MSTTFDGEAVRAEALRWVDSASYGTPTVVGISMGLSNEVADQVVFMRDRIHKVDGGQYATPAELVTIADNQELNDFIIRSMALICVLDYFDLRGPYFDPTGLNDKENGRLASISESKTDQGPTWDLNILRRDRVGTFRVAFEYGISRAKGESDLSVGKKIVKYRRGL
jgi:hypothetical protein